MIPDKPDIAVPLLLVLLLAFGFYAAFQGETKQIIKMEEK